MSDFTHFDEQGRARMVDIGDKPVTERFAKASGLVLMEPETQLRILDDKIEKGNVLEVARLAGIMSTKRTADIIPLCHPLPVSGVTIEFAFPSQTQISIFAEVRVTGRTGAEMEALTAVSTTALTIYDMCKAVDRSMTIHHVRLEEKWGGKSGHFIRKEDSPGQA